MSPLLAYSLYLIAVFPLMSSQRINPYTCERRPLQTSAHKLPGDNGFSIKILGDPKPEFYIPGQSYTVVLNGSYANQQFLDFMLVAVRKSDMNNEQYSAGAFTHLLDHMTKEDSNCPHVQTSVTYHQSYKKSLVSFSWMAPRSGAGCILFRATVLEHPDIWYRNDGGLTKMFCEAPEPTEPASSETLETISGMNKTAFPDDLADAESGPHTPRDHAKRGSNQCCACDVGKYEMTFVGNWSRETHPKDFPSGGAESLLHWSDIIGASHSPDYYLWRYDTLASNGVKQVCEFGWPKEMEQEIKAQNRAIRTVIMTKGIWGYPDLYTVQRSARFSVDNSRPFLSLLTMIGPSPDWCVGLDSVNLCLPDCSWAERLEFDLYPWDAGTDSGITFQSQNAVTFPQEKITNLTANHPNNPASPFYGIDPMIPMARVVLRRLNSRNSGGETGNCAAGQPSELEPETEDDAYVTELDNSDVTDPKCMVTAWSDFTPCSATCGVGTKVRVRQFKTPMGSIKNCPNVKTRQSDNCLGLINECANSGTEQVDICITTPWSTWSPCSATCESGTKTRTRQYLNFMGAAKCGHSLTDTITCHADIPDCDKAIMDIDWEMVCTLPAEVGRCRGSFPRYYWDTVMSKCLQFQYGGCRGNQNNFDTLDECHRSCGTIMPNDTELHSGHTNVDMDIDCMLTEWSPYSICSVSCGAGTKTRTRMVKVRNQRNGEPCPKDLYQTEMCANTCDNTTVNRDGENADCMFSEWRHWEPCSVTCGDGVQIRQRMVKRPARGNGAPCRGEVKDMRTCHMTDCGNSDYSQCMLSEWGDWGDCDCNSGKMMRQRMVKRGPCSPSEPLTSAKFCDTSNCPSPDASPVDCVLSDYTDWTPCSTSCNMGEQSRVRILIAPPRNGGRCEIRDGEDKMMEMRSCFLQLCAVEGDGRSVDCQVGPWGDWSPCSKTCGRGRKVRRRQAVVKARHNGRPCSSMKEVRQCDTGQRCVGPSPRKHRKRDRPIWHQNRQ